VIKRSRSPLRRWQETCLLSTFVAASALTAAAPGALAEFLSNVPAAAAHRYGARDDKGRSLDCLKVFQVGKAAYMAVYHCYEKKRFGLHLARSRDLLRWEHVTTLDAHASQGTVQRTRDGAFLLAYEKDAPNSCWIRLRLFENLARLAKGQFRREFDVPRSLAPTAEGTPSFERIAFPGGRVDQSRIDLRFHYFKDVHVDQLAGQPVAAFGHQEGGEVLQLAHFARALLWIELPRPCPGLLAWVQPLAHALLGNIYLLERKHDQAIATGKWEEAIQAVQAAIKFVPQDAVFGERDDRHVFIFKGDDKPEKRSVETVKVDGKMVEIREGLSEGDKILLSKPE